MIVGITGTNGAGKGEVVKFLLEKGFKHYSVRNYLIEEIEKRGMEVDRNSMIFVANDLREKNGSNYIVEELYRRAEVVEGDVVIESIRASGEVETLKEKGDFVLFAVDADPETRYSRIVERGDESDNVSFEEFLKQEKSEMSNSDSSKQNLEKCIEISDHLFINDWTIEDLKTKVMKVLEGLGFEGEKYSRPGWDEYFINISRTVATRGTCDRGRSGALIVRDRQILVTGYVGSPKGLPHCDEAGHLMGEWKHSDGIKRQHCVRTTHAEQNAICQAAKMGISIESATLYCKMLPCSSCAGMIINSGIKRVVCEKIYHAGGKTPKMFEMAGVKLDILNNEIEKYSNQ